MLTPPLTGPHKTSTKRQKHLSMQVSFKVRFETWKPWRHAFRFTHRQNRRNSTLPILIINLMNRNQLSARQTVFLRLHPRDSHIDYAYYLKGLINFNRGRGILDGWFPRDISKHEAATLHQSLQGFSTLVKRFPNSQYAGDAYQHMVYLRNMLAKQEIDNALFYIEREAWLAAANRAKKVLERYQESTWSLDALEILITAYTHLGLNDLAADTQRILDLNKDKYAKKELSLETDESLQAPPKIES